MCVEKKERPWQVGDWAVQAEEARIRAEATKGEKKKRRRSEKSTEGQKAAKKRETALEPVDEERLHSDLLAWLRAHGVKSTDSTYSTYIKQFRSYCEVADLEAFPASAVTVASFLRYLHEGKGLAKNTIKVASAAIASEYKLTGVQSQTKSELVKATMKVIGREAKPEKPKLPLTVELVKKLVSNGRNTWTETRDSFMIVLMMNAMLRESEAMALKMEGENEDVWIETMKEEGWKEAKEVLFVYVEKSKTDQERHGHTIVVGPAADPTICPVQMFKKWTLMRNKASKYLFHQKGSGAKLSAATPNIRLKTRLKRIGVDATKYGSHSARRGMCTAAAAKGIHERLLRKHGRWLSDCIYRYIVESVDNQLAVSAAVFGPVS